MGDYVEALLERMLTTPVHEIMREDEQQSGYEVILPGSVAWFPRSDWLETDVVSRDGNEVRIVAICARKPGTGAFTRMIAGIEAEGLRPVVIEPFPHMRSILHHRGWTGSSVGDGISREEQWRPTPKGTLP